MSEPRQIGTTPEGYEIWDNGKHFDWAICRKHEWAFLEAYGCSGFNIDEKCIGCLVEQHIIKRFEDCLCFEKYDCKDERCLTIMSFIELISGEQK